MSRNLNEAVTLLNDLLALGRTVTSVVDQVRLDAAVAALGDIALQDVERFSTQLASDLQDAIERGIADDAATAAAIIADEERAALEATQEERDQAERDERNAAGIS